MFKYFISFLCTNQITDRIYYNLFYMHIIMENFIIQIKFYDERKLNIIIIKILYTLKKLHIKMGFDMRKRTTWD